MLSVVGQRNVFKKSGTHEKMVCLLEHRVYSMLYEHIHETMLRLTNVICECAKLVKI